MLIAYLNVFMKQFWHTFYSWDQRSLLQERLLVHRLLHTILAIHSLVRCHIPLFPSPSQQNLNNQLFFFTGTWVVLNYIPLGSHFYVRACTVCSAKCLWFEAVIFIKRFFAINIFIYLQADRDESYEVDEELAEQDATSLFEVRDVSFCLKSFF